MLGPLTVMIICYSAIFWKVSQNNFPKWVIFQSSLKWILWLIFFFFQLFLQLDRYEQKVLKRENSITISYKTKVARMLFILVSIFILLHIPFTVLIFIRQKLLENPVMNQLEGGFYLLSCISHYCLYLNAAVNPIIYGLTNDNFRRAYHQTPIIPKHFGRLIHAVKQLKYKKVCSNRLFYHIFS